MWVCSLSLLTLILGVLKASCVTHFFSFIATQWRNKLPPASYPQPDADVKVWLLSLFYYNLKLEENLKDKNQNFTIYCYLKQNFVQAFITTCTRTHPHTHIKDAVGSAWNDQVRHTVSTQCWISWFFPYFFLHVHSHSFYL